MIPLKDSFCRYSFNMRYVVTQFSVFQAMSLYREAMLLGNGEAAYNLALIHLRRGEPGDEDEYVRLLQTASELGTTRATTELAVFLVERNLMPKALALFQQAAKEQVYIF